MIDLMSYVEHLKLVAIAMAEIQWTEVEDSVAMSSCYFS